MDAAPAVEADDAVATGQQDEEGAGSRSSEKRHLSVPPATGTSLTIAERRRSLPESDAEWRDRSKRDERANYQWFRELLCFE